MKLSLYLLASASIFKVVPLLQSTIIVWIAGAEEYAAYGYYILFAIMASTLFTAGIVPAYTRNYSEMNLSNDCGQRAELNSLRQFVIVALGAVVICTLLLKAIGFFHDLSATTAILLSVSLGVNSMLIPLLNIRGSHKGVLFGSTIYLILVVILACTVSKVTNEVFLVLFCLPPVLFALLLCILYFKNVVRNETLSIWPINRSQMFAASNEIMPVFLPNVFWMSMIFWFSHRISAWTPSQEVFSWYVIGLQIIGVLNFVPNTLAPIFLKRMVLITDGSSYRFALLTAVALVCIAFAVLISITIAVYALDFVKVPQGAQQIWCFLLLAGCISVAFSPLNGFLVKQRRAFYIFFSAAAWSLIAHIWFSIEPSTFAVAYCVGFCGALLSHLVIIFWVYGDIVKESSSEIERI